jgi:hypothetical protein
VAMAHQVCVLTAFSEDRPRQSSTVVTSVNCLELSADGDFAWDVPWQGLKSLRENSHCVVRIVDTPELSHCQRTQSNPSNLWACTLVQKNASRHLHANIERFYLLKQTISAGDGFSRDRALAGSCR